jgi:hypothetical protein
MRPTLLALSILLALSSPAAAQRVELAGRVTASRTVLSQRRVGEPRYIAISDLFYQDRTGFLEVLDLETRTVIQVAVKRALLERRFGHANDGVVAVPQGEVVMYRDGIAGVALSESTGGRSHRTWYIEINGSGKIVRAAGLATVGEGEQLQIIGTDPVAGAAWFALTKDGGRGRSVVLRRLDLGSLEVRDDQRIALASRAERGGREHAVEVHASADFSKFAIVEYAEDGVAMAPAKIIIADPTAQTSFAVPAPPTVYGVAFAADNRFLYVASAQRGTISRVDLAAGRIDKQVQAPRNVHHLIVSPTGTRLLAFATSNTYAVYDLPDLKARNDAPHPSGIAAAMVQLHGEGIASLDGAFFVVPDVEDRHRVPRERTYVIARIVD